MSEPAVVRLAGAGKMYRLFASRTDRLLDAFGLGRLVRPRSTEFWALRGIDLELPPGRRIGIVGRNGAGKSTLLKLITGHLEPTEGEVEVEDPIESLSEPGGGFHPEFTGAENVRVALTLRGLSRERIEEALADVAEFTELGEFLDRPFGTYSSGMKARLAFAAATSLVSPRVLVVDEVLGAGDAYFLSRCAERMGRLVSGGATMLLVSHALEQVTRLCDEALWLDRGRVVARGPVLEVVKAYQQFMRLLDERRLRERNRSSTNAPATGLLRCRIAIEGRPDARVDVREVLLVVGAREERVRVGGAQDGSAGQESGLDAEGSRWSEARSGDGSYWRSLEAGAAGTAAGTVQFVLDPREARKDYALEIEYRRAGGEVTAAVELDDRPLTRWELSGAGPGWTRQRLPLGPLALGSGGPSIETGYVASAGRAVRRWPGEGTLVIDGVRFLGEDGSEQAAFEVHSRLTLELTVGAERAGPIGWLPVAVIYRKADGLLVSRYVGERTTSSVRVGERLRALLRLDPVRLGNGHYVVSISLHGRFDTNGVEEPITYDVVDRSYEFAVFGTPPLLDGVLVPTERWQFVSEPR